MASKKHGKVRAGRSPIWRDGRGERSGGRHGNTTKMKLTYKYALSTVLAAAMVTPAFAQQEGYRDVPENHWAYEALVRLKREGLLVGYPDGEFKGRRLTTRYELASAIYAVYMNLKNTTDSLQTQIDALKGASGGTDNTGPLRDQIAALQNDVNTLKGYGDEIATLRRLTDSFQKELQSLGVDVEAMKKDISDLQTRVTRLEQNKPAVEFGGDANLFLSVGFGSNGGVGANQDGKVFGFNRQGQNAAGFEDLSIIHDLGLNFKGTNTTGPKFKGTLVIGNGYNSNTGTGFGNQSDYAAFTNTQYDEGDTSLFLQNLEVEFPTSIGGLGFNARVGRIGYKVSPMILQRIDTTSFYENARWDNGLFAVDGAEVGFDFGGGKLTAILARAGDQKTTNTNAFNTLNFQNITVGGEQATFLAFQGLGNSLPGGLPVARIMGVNFATNLFYNGKLNASYLLLDGNNNYGFVGSTGGAINRAEVFGGDVTFGFNKIEAGAAFGQTNYKADNSRTLDENNKYYSANAAYTGDRFGVYGGYRFIETNYLAPGDWGRYGLIRNPTNVKGFNVGGSFELTESLLLKGSYENLETIVNGSGRIEKYAANLEYNLPAGARLLGGYENTKFKNYNAGPQPEYSFVTAGIGYNFTTNSTFKLTYQYADIKNDFVIGNQRGTGGTFKGNFFASQLSVKF